ncbi:HNH endonuclease [Psychrobacillus sp. INOP01]|uniref:HNH endonuclease n=1 Tax=Psychrobacillus sp. INOP01 TaxID=2829187 RepID=UPI001BADBE5C|nr:HNH endonuclease [Psychrobacillus sp. INOP01]QUG41314.1 HNH endonuclease [Psychrobacillus sp. INOP01]
MAKKTCKKCLKAKAISQFVKDKRNKDGTTNICKVCRNTALRKPPRRYIGKKEQECSICHEIKPYDNFYKSKMTKNGREPRCNKCRAVDPKPFKAYWRLMAKQKLYAIPIEITKEEVAMIFEAFEGECIYCGAEESKETGTINLEHIVPMARNGRHHVSNLCCACTSCNSKKRNKPLIEFYRSHEPFTGKRLDYIFKHVAYFAKRDPEEVAQEFYAAVNDE